jgi:hypothetical protein
MRHPTGESESDALRFDFDRRLMLHALGLYHHCNNRRTGRRALVPPITPAARSEVQAEQHQLKSQLVPPSAVLLGVFFVSDDAGFLRCRPSSTTQRISQPLQGKGFG